MSTIVAPSHFCNTKYVSYVQRLVVRFKVCQAVIQVSLKVRYKYYEFDTETIVLPWGRQKINIMARHLT